MPFSIRRNRHYLGHMATAVTIHPVVQCIDFSGQLKKQSICSCPSSHLYNRYPSTHLPLKIYFQRSFNTRPQDHVRLFRSTLPLFTAHTTSEICSPKFSPSLPSLAWLPPPPYLWTSATARSTAATQPATGSRFATPPAGLFRPFVLHLPVRTTLLRACLTATTSRWLPSK